MNKTNLEFFEINKENNKEVDSDTLSSAFLIEDGYESHYVFKIILTGEYNKEYTIATECCTLDNSRVIIEGKYLLICFWYQFIIVDVETDKIFKSYDLNFGEIFSIYKFKSGYFIYAECFNYYFNKDFELIWQEGCADIFVNLKMDNNLEIFKDYITVIDWCGVKHFYNEQGEFKTEYYRNLDCYKD